ncbi:hypothetical protein [Streptomyces caniscabiei]|uniref:Secreted protein n=1 Tax=Streptomyces caniscabiei TaxID=2746961 RepID=A0ABU4MZF2_9ACTN|nr:hypothetical protein [Streptomyces caniscabiei]MBE4790281.1 hypothetical protein [Streptomyces caniscabiei]MBE4799490.1 hypothetical protein [Streptomyces caniscabiei]MDX3015138.1 hypothetical protein [Streptomyces caniscabiei]MDX3042581.1 hypothetical protein [Streptomyces caniscabiei]
MSRRLRRPGGRWRLLVHEYLGRVPGQREGAGGPAHTVTPDPAFARKNPDGDLSRTHLIAGTEFDELVVGSWLHVEQLDTSVWWANIGGVTVHVTADRDGRPKRVWVCGPEDYDAPRPGCAYELSWTNPGKYAKEGDR